MTPLCIELPDWIGHLPSPPSDGDDEARMAFVLALVDRQITEGTGGPFAAAVFDGVDGGVLGVAVNRVEATSMCIAHAETMALAMAGRAVGSYTLDGRGAVLVASTEPCAMCLGAVGWSGIARLVCGAKDADARAVGFDEGNKPADWMDMLRSTGVVVVTGVLRARAAAGLARYVDTGGTVYNG